MHLDASTKWWAMIYGFSFAFICVVGVPSLFLLSSVRLIRWWSLAIVGAIIGYVCGRYMPTADPVGANLVSCAVGALCGIVFWVILELGSELGEDDA